MGRLLDAADENIVAQPKIQQCRNRETVLF